MIKLFEMFAGYGGASFALEKAKIDFECVGYSEINPNAIQCYKNNHKTKMNDSPCSRIKNLSLDIVNYGDCTKINPNELLDFDLLTGGFPCQSFSVAGNGMGELETRGTLFNEIIRIADIKQPRYMILENVKGLTNKKHKQTFDKIISELQRIGYFVHWGLFNSKEYGIPQNRDRVFFICFRDHKEFMSFAAPKKEELTISVKDILEENVDDKYYLDEKQLIKWGIYKENPNTDIIIQPRGDEGLRKSYNVCPTLYYEMRGWTPGLWNTFVIFDGKGWRVFTPEEVFRLMGFEKREISLDGVKENQKYKLAGNGWDINLVSKICLQIIKSRSSK